MPLNKPKVTHYIPTHAMFNVFSNTFDQMVSRIFIQQIYEFNNIFLVNFFLEVKFLLKIEIHKKNAVTTLYFNKNKTLSSTLKFMKTGLVVLVISGYY